MSKKSHKERLARRKRYVKRIIQMPDDLLEEIRGRMEAELGINLTVDQVRKYSIELQREGYIKAV